MKIAITHPFCWPYVRRGAERFMSELGSFLATRGHEVITISSKPGRGCIEETPDGTRILHRQWWTPAMAHLRLQPALGFLLPCYRSIRRLRPDLVQSLYYVDAWASKRAGRGHKTVYYVTGPPVPGLQRRIPPDRRLLREAIEGADQLLVPSQYIRGLVQEYYGRDSKILPVPIHAGSFAKSKSLRSSRPIILAVAAFDERRKGLRVLLRAFARLHRRMHDALLRISGQVSEDLRREVLADLLPAVRDSVEFLGLGRQEDLPDLYSQASITVVPAMWESYGLVILESWAAGTPVLAANHGGLPEMVTDPALGVLFDPGTDPYEPNGDEALADGMEAALELAARKSTEESCRLRAAQFSWANIGSSFEQFYLDLICKAK
jgi:glycosyltransferase involved in cell wall biosynthesis